MLKLEKTAEHTALYIDGMCQGRINSEGEPLSPYMKPVMERIAGLNTRSEILFLGGGLYVLPKWAQDRHHSVSVIEVDKDVQAAARPRSDSFYMGIGDARTAIDSLEEDWFDFIFLDVWPNHDDIYCVEYYNKCKKHLKKNGTFSMNLVSTDKDVIEAHNKALASIFKNVKFTTIYADKEMKKPVQEVYFCHD